MAETFAERQDIAAAGSDAVNAQFNPPVLLHGMDNFGIQPQPIYIYNTSSIEFNEPRYPNHPHMWIKACPADKPWVLCNAIEHPFRERTEDANGNKSSVLTDGFKEATRMLNPLNPGTDQNFTDPDPLNVGGNLNAFGVFWSTNFPPTEAELEAARKRMERTFTAELELLAGIESQNPDEARTRANKISHAAAEYFGVSTSWHRSDLRPKKKAGSIECPNCGESIAPTSAVCRHCEAVLDEEKARKLFPDRFKRGPGRPAND